MGIEGLIPQLAGTLRPCNIAEFQGRTVAVDAYCWLHRAARGCATQLAMSQDNTIYIINFMKYVRMMLYRKVNVILVFDGRLLAAKRETEEKRRETKKATRQQAIDLMRLGRFRDAAKYFKQTVEVTPEMALEVIKECRKVNVDCIVAPYEADAQLAFFSINGYVDCVISEDSDLLVFGCRKVLYKMNQWGDGSLAESENIKFAFPMFPNRYSFDKFRYMCILSGCDYLKSLPGIGLKKALKFVSIISEENPEVFLDKIPRYLNLRHLIVTDEYKRNFMIADATFKHQIVYDPFQRQLVPLTPIDTKPEYCVNAGEMFDSYLAYQLALGNINPLNMHQIDTWTPGSDPRPNSIWSRVNSRRLINHRINCELSGRENDNGLPVTCRRAEANGVAGIESFNIQYDQQMNEAFAFYRRAHDEGDNTSESTTTSNSQSSQHELSPVLSSSSNPFVRTRISKFSATNGSPNVVRSKFFFSSNSGTSNEEPNCTISINPSENGSSIIPNEHSSVIPEEIYPNVPQSDDEDSFSDDIPYIEVICTLQEGDTPLVISEITGNIIQPALVSVENIPEASTSNKRKSDNEISPDSKQKKAKKAGTAENPSGRPKKQPTILEAFKKMTSK